MTVSVRLTDVTTLGVKVVRRYGIILEDETCRFEDTFVNSKGRRVGQQSTHDTAFE